MDAVHADALVARDVRGVPRAEWGDYENAAPVARLDLDADLARWPGTRTAHELNREVPRSAG